MIKFLLLLIIFAVMFIFKIFASLVGTASVAINKRGTFINFGNQYLKNTTVLGLNMGAFTSFTRNELQSTNHLMFYLGFAGILIGAAMFVFFSQKRKIYYLSNYITVGLSSIYNIVCGIIVFSHLSTWINYINTRVDFNTINAYQSSLNEKTEIIEYFKASDYTYIFVIVFIICALLVIAGLIGIGFIVTRILYQKKHKGLDLSEVKIND